MADAVGGTTAGGAPPQDLRREVEEKRGYWHEWHQGLLDASPDYLRAYLDFHQPPFTSGNLEPKVCEFIYIAADAAVNHLYLGGIEMHIGMALEKGATAGEVVEVIQLTMLSAHTTHAAGMPILAEELARAGGHDEALLRPLTPEEQAAKERYVAATGYWPEGGDALFRFAPGFVKGFLAYGEIPYLQGPLAPKVKEFVCIALYGSPVAPQAGPLRQHIRRALEVGATAAEIADVLQLTSAIAIHTCVAAVPALTAATKARRGRAVDTA